MKLEKRMERENGMTNLLFLLLGLILGLFIGVLSVSLATYSKQAKRYCSFINGYKRQKVRNK